MLRVIVASVGFVPSEKGPFADVDVFTCWDDTQFAEIVWGRIIVKSARCQAGKTGIRLWPARTLIYKRT